MFLRSARLFLSRGEFRSSVLPASLQIFRETNLLPQRAYIWRGNQEMKCFSWAWSMGGNQPPMSAAWRAAAWDCPPFLSCHLAEESTPPIRHLQHIHIQSPLHPYEAFWPLHWAPPLIPQPSWLLSISVGVQGFVLAGLLSIIKHLISSWYVLRSWSCPAIN